ncbi:MAG: hypothetical protein COB22_05995 [Cycloclasticus sp.]|nr:MAG: hypothetical protein COB22_05995 [Cycloclasticus sp.]
MGCLVKILHHDFTPDKDERERVSVWMGDAACVAGRVVLMPEYEVNDGVTTVFLVVYTVDGRLISRVGVGPGINLVSFGVPVVLFPRAITFGENERPEKLLVDVWISEHYAAKKGAQPIVKPHTGDGA